MKLFIWDFHGVLEKDNEKAVFVISNIVLERFGYKERLTLKQNDEYLGLKWYQYFERMMPELPMKKCMELQKACFEFGDHDNKQTLKDNIKPNNHAVEVLKKIKESGNKQLVISNTRQDDLIWYLDTVGITKYFNDAEIIGVNAHQTHSSKSDALKEYLKGKKFSQIISIGDSEGDLELGKEFGATTYYYRHPKRKHESTKNADFIINDLREVLKEL